MKKFYLLLLLFISCFICACASSKISTDTNKAAIVNGDQNQSATKIEENCYEPFYIYKDFQSPENHYSPSGWMGDVANLELNQAFNSKPLDGEYCIEVSYTSNGLKQWAGVYWQHPEGNWGDKKGGYDLTGATKLTFWAKGANGYEVISEAKIGGISGAFSDSDVAWLKKIKLTGYWKKYTIDLSKSDLSTISGGFCIVLSDKDNPNGCKFYLDEIRYE